MVRLRQQLVFEKYGTQSVFDADSDSSVKNNRKSQKRIGINRSFLVNTYYPLYSTFFAELGFKIVVPDVYTQKGIDQRNASFCYPAELTHGFFHSLIEMKNPRKRGHIDCCPSRLIYPFGIIMSELTNFLIPLNFRFFNDLSSANSSPNHHTCTDQNQILYNILAF